MERVSEKESINISAHRNLWGRSVGTARLRYRTDEPLDQRFGARKYSTAPMARNTTSANISDEPDTLDADDVLIAFATQNDARSTLDRLSFARQITKDGKTGLALPRHIISDDKGMGGTL